MFSQMEAAFIDQVMPSGAPRACAGMITIKHATRFAVKHVEWGERSSRLCWPARGAADRRFLRSVGQRSDGGCFTRRRRLDDDWPRGAGAVGIPTTDPVDGWEDAWFISTMRTDEFICQMIGAWLSFCDAGTSSGSSWSSPYRSGSHGCSCSHSASTRPGRRSPASRAVSLTARHAAFPPGSAGPILPTCSSCSC